MKSLNDLIGVSTQFQAEQPLDNVPVVDHSNQISIGLTKRTQTELEALRPKESEIVIKTAMPVPN